VLGASGCSESKPSKADLRLAAGDVKTFAAAAKLLIDEQLAGHLTGTFFTKQSESLSEKVRSTKETLNEPAGDLDPYRAQILQAASELDTALAAIQSSGPAATAPNEFAQMTTRARELENQLKDK
jgi:hypothetical protein